MAQTGFYPDPPSRRMAYDQDGTIVLVVEQTYSFIVEMTQAQRITINNESNDYFDPSDPYNYYLTFMFPEKRNVTHYYAAWQKTYFYGVTQGNVVQWSNNTTNGIDGTWTTAANTFVTNSNNGEGAGFPLTTPGMPDMRLHIQALPVTGVRAIRFLWQGASNVNRALIFSHHLYGHKTAGETPHRLDFTYNDTSELIIDEDYGDQPRGTTRIWSTVDTWNEGTPLYLRNRSPEKVATTVTVSTEALTGNMVNNLTLSKDNITYGTQITYTSIQPLEQVGPIYVKHVVPSNNVLGPVTARVRTDVGSWV